jgi:hypothetical protein
MHVTVNGKDVRTFDGGAFFWPARPGLGNPATHQVKDVELKAGWNTVLLSMTCGRWSEWSFGLRIMDEKCENPATGLRYTAELPKEN